MDTCKTRKRLALAITAALLLPGMAVAQTAKERELETRIAQLEAQVQALLTRFSALSDEIKEILRVRWTAVKEDMVPNTPRRAEILRDPKFEKMAFREVVSGFFARLDGGATTEGALAGV